MNNFWFLRSLCNNSDFKIEKQLITVGRHKIHDLECKNVAISRKHAELSLEGDDLFVKAHKTLNGTCVNGHKVPDDGKVKLSEGDKLYFGFTHHPTYESCEENHYCYIVMKRQLPVNDSMDLLRILEGDDESVKEEPKELNSDGVVSYSNNEEVIIIDDDDNFEIFSQQIFNEKSFVKTEPVECIEITDSENDDADILSCFEALTSMANLVSDDDENLQLCKDSDRNVRQEHDIQLGLEIDGTNLRQDENQNLMEKHREYNSLINNEVEMHDILREKNKEDNKRKNGVLKSTSPIVDRSFLVQSKYSKPTAIIAPHDCVKKRRKSVQDVDQGPKRQRVEENVNGDVVMEEFRLENRRKPERTRSNSISNANGIMNDEPTSSLSLSVDSKRKHIESSLKKEETKRKRGKSPKDSSNIQNHQDPVHSFNCEVILQSMIHPETSEEKEKRKPGRPRRNSIHTTNREQNHQSSTSLLNGNITHPETSEKIEKPKSGRARRNSIHTTNREQNHQSSTSLLNGNITHPETSEKIEKPKSGRARRNSIYTTNREQNHQSSTYLLNGNITHPENFEKIEKRKPGTSFDNIGPRKNSISTINRGQSHQNSIHLPNASEIIDLETSQVKEEIKRKPGRPRKNSITNNTQNNHVSNGNKITLSHTSQKNEGIKRRSKNKQNAVNTSTRDSDFPQNVTVPKKLTFRQLENSAPSTSKATNTLQDNRDPRLKPCIKNGLNKNGERSIYQKKIVNDNDLEAVLDCAVSCDVQPTIVDPKNYYSLFKKPSCSMVFSIIGWNVKWLDEQKTLDKPPPITQSNVVKMCTHFQTYADYCNVIKPFIALEIWDNISQGFGRRFRTSIYEVQKRSQFQIFRCIAYTNHHDKRVLREGDVIVMNIGVRPHKDARQAGIKCLFAYVINCKKHTLKPTDFIYEDLLSENTNISMQLEIHLLVKPFPEEVLVAKFVDATVLTSITSTLREYDALMWIKKSPITNMILNPRIKNFKIERNDNINIKTKGLSEKQIIGIREACTLCVGNKPGLYLIQGPPGTGKTTVIRHIIENLVTLKRDIRILVVAPSNVTVDGIVRKLSKDKTRTDMVRVGIHDSIGTDLHWYFLDEIVKRKMVDQMLREKPEVRMDFNMLKQKKDDLHRRLSTNNSNDIVSYNQLKRELKEADGEISNFAQNYYTDKHYWNTFHRVRREVMSSMNIICTTLNSCCRLQEYNLKIDCCIVDEASQSKETETLIPLSLGVEKMVLVGDPQQLPAVTLSKYAKDLGYGQSLFARIKKAFSSETNQPITMLDLQYRMHSEICKYPSNTFYKGMLHTASICNKRGGLDRLAPYYLFNLNVPNEQGNEYVNHTEVKCVVKLLMAIQETIGYKPNKFYTVGVITPYNSQKRDLLVQMENLRMPSIKITVNTVDSFQGSEKDIIILSCVRARANSFLNDEQRMNVALTRARRVLYVVGTNPLFDSCPTLKSLKQNAESRKLYLNICKVNETILKSLIVKKS